MIVFCLLFEDVGEADDGVEGCAEFMADIGEEFAFEFIGFKEGDIGGFQFTESQVEGAVAFAQAVVGEFESGEHLLEGLGQFSVRLLRQGTSGFETMEESYYQIRPIPFQEEIAELPDVFFRELRAKL